MESRIDAKTGRSRKVVQEASWGPFWTIDDQKWPRFAHVNNNISGKTEAAAV